MRGFLGFLAAVCTGLFLTWAGVRIYDNVMFNIHCGDYLKRAADSNSIELAESNLAMVTAYAESNSLTSGNTGLFWNSPSNDVGFWYNNVKTSLAEVRKVRAQPDATDLERSNVLIKLEKTMLDQGKDGSSVVVPGGISIFPNNLGFFWWAVLSFIGILLFGGLAVFGNWD